MTYIYLTQDRVAFVDPENFDWLTETNWSYTEQGYAVRGHNGKREYMHRLIIGAKKGEIVDHINGDRLDNRRSNLRIVSRSTNAFHRKDVRGISRHGDGWSAELVDHGVRYRKWFRSKADAIAERRKYEAVRGAN